jgi:TRAP-type C4-dicarboxylate transport system permease small subunit
MDKKTGLIISIVVTVLALCCSLACCGFGIAQLATDGDMVDMPPAWGIPLICLGILVWVLPLVLWIVTSRAKESEPEF